jgi:hypothetical protein
LCGVVLTSENWKLLIRTHAFPQNLAFTFDPAEVAEFLHQYGPFNGE